MIVISMIDHAASFLVMCGAFVKFLRMCERVIRNTERSTGNRRLVDYAGRTEYYYYVFKDGRARYTKRAPKSAKDPMQAVEGSAYWFMESPSKITFIWKNSALWKCGPRQVDQASTRA
jgi:hypothetical protein